MKAHITFAQCQGKTYLIEQYYHRSWRVWVSYKVDQNGNQLTDCEYDVDKNKSAYFACLKEPSPIYN